MFRGVKADTGQPDQCQSLQVLGSTTQPQALLLIPFTGHEVLELQTMAPNRRASMTPK